MHFVWEKENAVQTLPGVCVWHIALAPQPRYLLLRERKKKCAKGVLNINVKCCVSCETVVNSRFIVQRHIPKYQTNRAIHSKKGQS